MTGSAGSASPAAQSPYVDDPEEPSRLGQAAAVVGIVVGVVFIVAVIFFTGFFLAADRSGYEGPDEWRHSGQMGSSGRPGTCPMMGGSGMMGPNMPPTPMPLP